MIRFHWSLSKHVIAAGLELGEPIAIVFSVKKDLLSHIHHNST